MKKNDIIEIEITDISAEGSGIGRFEGMAVFVPLTAVGDRLLCRIVKVKKSYAFGIIEQLITTSPDRCEPDCGVFKKCGGCVLRHISYESECALKQNRVYQVIKRIGGVDMPPQPIRANKERTRYRNKAQYPIAQSGETGFYATHSHRIIPCEDCLLQPQEFSAAAKALGEWIRENNISVYDENTHNGLVRHLYMRKAEKTGELMAVIVINGSAVPARDSLIKRLTEALGENLKSIQLNFNTEDTNVVLGSENRVIFGKSHITDILCDVKVRISPLSFYQVNRDMAELLYKKAAQYAMPQNKSILDLYCGAGTIGLSMARQAESIIGVEIVEDAIKDAEINARENGITNARFICADAAQAAQTLKTEGIKPDVVIVDPPRKGCSEELINTICGDFSPERIVYISCDPATLARDTALIENSGYHLQEYTPFDLFPGTAHVETVALFKII